jgi:hypothetical protein
MVLNNEYAKEWLNQLKEYWFRKDIKKATSLFDKTVFYQENPFKSPYVTFEEIVQEWQHVKDQDIKNIEFEILAIDCNTLIVIGYLKEILRSSMVFMR